MIMMWTFLVMKPRSLDFNVPNGGGLIPIWDGNLPVIGQINTPCQLHDGASGHGEFQMEWPSEAIQTTDILRSLQLSSIAKSHSSP